MDRSKSSHSCNIDKHKKYGATVKKPKVSRCKRMQKQCIKPEKTCKKCRDPLNAEQTVFASPRPFCRAQFASAMYTGSNPIFVASEPVSASAHICCNSSHLARLACEDPLCLRSHAPLTPDPGLLHSFKTMTPVTGMKNTNPLPNIPTMQLSKKRGNEPAWFDYRWLCE